MVPRPPQHRFTWLRRRDRVRRGHVDGRGGGALHRRDWRRARRAGARDAPASRRRLLVQSDRPFGVLHAALEHPEGRARGARVLRRRRMRRQPRLAHAGGRAGGRGRRDPPARSAGVPHDDRQGGQRAAPSVRLRRDGDRDRVGGRQVPGAGGRNRGLRGDPRRPAGVAVRRGCMDRRGRTPRAGRARRSRAPQTSERDAAAARAHPGAAQLRAWGALRSRSRDQAAGGATPRGGCSGGERRVRGSPFHPYRAGAGAQQSPGDAPAGAPRSTKSS